MDVTSLSLLQRLRSAGPEEADWERFQEIYAPLIRKWVARIPGSGNEIDDVTQEVMLTVFKKISSFERQREGSFRAWLRQVSVNCLISTFRKLKKNPITVGDPTGNFLDSLADPQNELAAEWDHEHDRHVTEKLLGIVRPDFSEQTWEAFSRFALQRIPASQVASELQMTENAVLLAKSRILKRLREEAGELLD